MDNLEKIEMFEVMDRTGIAERLARLGLLRPPRGFFHAPGEQSHGLNV